MGLSPPEYDVHLLLLYLADVGNGGHAQFFMNPGGGFAAELPGVLERIGLSRVREILQRACCAFPGSSVPVDGTVRRRFIDGLSATTLADWGQLDRELGQVAGAALSRALQYVRESQDRVLVEERS